ncbi:MAG: NADH-quinone oxidoreductase subunit C [Burkholderiales bacterium]|nr:NADH-quinone oxidoreductase subunit C [Burkholderiales bacterium]
MKPIVMALNHELAQADLAAWSRQIAEGLDGGARLVSLFGRTDSGEVVTTAVLQREDGQLGLLRGRGRRGDTYPSLTPLHPAAQMFERELWEQTGLTPAGHPWLKPVRYEGERQQQMAEHPFFSVRGQEVHEVGVGPIHASVIEPGHFRFMCHGEQVHHLELQLGYQHRDVESLLLKRPPLALTSLVESIAGDTSIAYAWGYCAAVEALSGTQVSMTVDRLRGVALELERVAMHLVALTGLATDIAFLQGGASYGRLRTAIINATMRVCGSRFGRGWLRPGGVRFGITDALRRDLLDTLAAFAQDIAEVNALMLGARSVQSRFQGVGVVSRKAAADIGMVGLAARASGVAGDARISLPGRLYATHPIASLTEDGGDCWARMTLRMREISESLRWLKEVLEAPALILDSADEAPLAPLGPLWHDTLCVSVREGFRGPVVQALETGPDGGLLHYKVQDPSLLNWFGLGVALRDNEISDFPICNKSFDLSYCGNDL